MNRFYKFSFLFITVLCFENVTIQAQNEDLKGSAVFGSMRARSIGPALMSGRISDIDAVNKNPDLIYVGTAGGGVWKSANGGMSFNPIFDKHPQSGKVCVDQNHPDTVWVGTGEPWTRNSTSIGNGIYLSTNGGKDWENTRFKKL